MYENRKENRMNRIVNRSLPTHTAMLPTHHHRLPSTGRLPFAGRVIRGGGVFGWGSRVRLDNARG